MEGIHRQPAMSDPDMHLDGPVFILSNMREYGGAEKSIATLVPYLAGATQVHIFTENQRHHDDLARIESPNLTLTRTAKGNSPAAILRTFWIILRAYLQERPTVLLANGHKGAMFMAMLRLLLPGMRARCAVYIRDFDYYWLHHFLKPMPDALLLAPSQSIFEHPRYRRWGIERWDCQVVENAVEPGRDSDSVAQPESFVGCCARLLPWKGVEYLIRAFRLVVDAVPEAKLRVHGEPIDEAYVAKLHALVTELRLGESVALHDFTPKIADVYRAGAFFVVPSLNQIPGPESFSRIVIESWSHRRPVIAFAVGGPRYLIDDGVDGFLVEEKNVGQLAERIVTLLGDPGRRDEMGRRGFEKVRTRFNPSDIAGSLLKTLYAKGRSA